MKVSELIEQLQNFGDLDADIQLFHGMKTSDVRLVRQHVGRIILFAEERKDPGLEPTPLAAYQVADNVHRLGSVKVTRVR